MTGKRIESHYAIALGDVDPYAVADDILLPLEVVASFGGGNRPDIGSGFEITGAQISSLRRQEGQVEVRIFNPTDDEVTVSIPSQQGWLIDLRGRPLEAVESSFLMKAHKIATLRITTAS